MQKLDKKRNVCYDASRNKFNNFVINLLRNGIILVKICFGGKENEKRQKAVYCNAGITAFFSLLLQTDMSVQAGNSDNLEDLRGGVAALLNPDVTNSVEVVSAAAREWNLNLQAQERKDAPVRW